MLLNELAPEVQKPQAGDIVVVTTKKGSYTGVVGEVNNEIAYIYDFKTRKKIGTVILKYLSKHTTSSKHLRKVLARHLGFQSSSDENASKFFYVDKKRVKTNYDAGFNPDRQL